MSFQPPFLIECETPRLRGHPYAATMMPFARQYRYTVSDNLSSGSTALLFTSFTIPARLSDSSPYAGTAISSWMELGSMYRSVPYFSASPWNVSLRHSCASILFEMGWTPKEIQHWLGHADYYTTMNIYTHLSSEAISYKSAALNDSLMLIEPE